MIKRNYLLLALLLLAQSASADWTKLASNSFEMASPPTPGSAADEKDFAQLHKYQDTRTKADCEEARAQVSYTFENFFGPETGQLTEAQFEKYEPLFKKVFKLASRIGGYFKDTYERPRPYVTDETLSPCVLKPGAGRAYPSGHATLGMVGGCLLAKAIPKSAKQLESQGKRIGDLRMIAGVHHPTDVKAGQKLGLAICERLMEDADFVEELRP